MLCIKCKIQMTSKGPKERGVEYICPSCGYKALGGKESSETKLQPRGEFGNLQSSAPAMNDAEFERPTPSPITEPVVIPPPPSSPPTELPTPEIPPHSPPPPTPHPIPTPSLTSTTPPSKTKKVKKSSKPSLPTAQWRGELLKMNGALEEIEKNMVKELRRFRSRLEELEKEIRSSDQNTSSE